MALNWAWTVFFAIVAYSLYSYFGQRVGASPTAWRAATVPFTDWLNFGLILAGTLAFSLALFFGGRASAFAVTVVIALGVVVSFAFAAMVGGVAVKPLHLGGIAMILTGIACLR